MTGCTDTFTLSLYKWRLQMLLNERGNWEFKSLLDFFFPPVSVFPGVVLYCEMQVCFGAREIERREKAMWISAPSHKRTSLLSALASTANPLIFHRFSTAHAVPAKSSLFHSLYTCSWKSCLRLPRIVNILELSLLCLISRIKWYLLMFSNVVVIS